MAQLERDQNGHDIEPDGVERRKHERGFGEQTDEQDSDYHQKEQDSISRRLEQR